MKMNLSVSSDLISGSERALNMMRECGVLTIPKPTAAHQLIRRADAEGCSQRYLQGFQRSHRTRPQIFCR